MHIPDGYLSPATYISSYATAVPLFAYGIKKLKENLDDKTLPLISSLTALSFLVMMINIPIPGGTSGHAIGAAAISILTNPWIGFISLSLVLLIQAIIFGDGGITAWAVNSLSMGFVASFTAYFSYRFLSGFNRGFALFFSGWISAVVSSLVIAVFLGIQPMIAHTPDGKPLFFPFGLEITVPALVLSHMVYFGIVEGVYTFVVVRFIQKTKNQILGEINEV
ncbi:cobalt transporter CbiM [Persephonella sp.]|uniref:cobalt transporter CbiM n=1 Tax=Persephonella sp. TaxID=2060922 RepID=UPI0025CCB370|nr:cobalt transporter CbiM [Persephonella sp.]